MRVGAGLHYTMVSAGPSDEQTGPSEPGFINGGMFQRGDWPAKGPAITIDVEDIDTALASIEEHGGKTLRGRETVGEMGFSAYFEDPEGNVVGLWQNAG